MNLIEFVNEIHIETAYLGVRFTAYGENNHKIVFA